MHTNHKRIKHKTVILGAFILGILIALYLKTLNPNKVYITLAEKMKIESEIDYTKKEIKKLEVLKEDNKKTLQEYKSVLGSSNKTITEVMEEELKHLKVVSGYSDIAGPGVIVTIKDSERDLESGENPNDLIVHDIDILRVLNDLKKAGAKAISINGERVIPKSKIKCSGATITVNETTYGQPFIIRAIGDVDMLKASIISPQSYASLLRDVYGISVNLEVKNKIIINSYEKNK